MAIIEEISAQVMAGKAKTMGDLVQQALDEGVKPDVILNTGLIDTLREVGRRFEIGQAFVPEMLIAANAMKAALVVLRPHLVSTGVKPIGKLAIGTVKGDLHDIGKSLVAMMCEGAGLEVVDLGVDTEPERFVEAIENGADIIGMSALLTTTMVQMKTVVQTIEDAGLRDRVRIIVGGAPITPEYADEIGADGYGADAGAAARIARELITAT